MLGLYAYCTSLQISEEFGILSAGGSVTDEPLDRALPLSASLQATVALPSLSTVTLLTVSVSGLDGYGAMTAVAALSELVMSALLMLVTCDTKSATVRAVSVTLRSTAIPW